MTDREFWQKFYRHAKGMADAVKELLDDETSGTLGGFIIPAQVIDELGDGIEKLIDDITLQEAHGGDCEEVAGGR